MCSFRRFLVAPPPNGERAALRAGRPEPSLRAHREAPNRATDTCGRRDGVARAARGAATMALRAPAATALLPLLAQSSYALQRISALGYKEESGPTVLLSQNARAPNARLGRCRKGRAAARRRGGLRAPPLPRSGAATSVPERREMTALERPQQRRPSRWLDSGNPAERGAPPAVVVDWAPTSLRWLTLTARVASRWWRAQDRLGSCRPPGW